MARLLILLTMLAAVWVPATARALPAMACCPPEMTAAMAGHHGAAHDRHDPPPPADAAECAVPSAIPDAPGIAAAMPPQLVARALALAVPALTGLAPAAEPRPPRSA